MRILLALLLTVAAWAQPLTWQSLRRKDGPDTRRLQSLLQRMPAQLKKNGPWRHFPLRSGGAFVSESWLRGGTVINDGFMRRAGSGWYRIETLHYKLPDTFGLLFSAGHNPKRDGVGVRFWYCLNGKSIVSDAADLSFSLWKAGQAGPDIPILRYPVQVSDDYQMPARWLPVRPQARVDKITSGAALKKIALDGYADIMPALKRALPAVKRKVYGKYAGDGIPPPVTYVDLTPAEQRILRKDVEGQVKAWTRAVNANGEEFFRVYRQVVPW